MEPPQYEPIATLGKQGFFWEVPFFGSFRGSGFESPWILPTRGGSLSEADRRILGTEGYALEVISRGRLKVRLTFLQS